VREIVAAVARAAGRPVPAEETGRRAGDVAALVADAGRAASLLGWQPRHSDLDSIVASAVAWARRRHNHPR
jgi:UDP-glucose 4-epimerase